MPKKVYIFSLGGSLVVPNEIDISFLKQFRKLILKLLKLNHKIVIVVGGGKISKKYNLAAQEIIKISNDDLDWLGIAATKLNAELLRVVFAEYAYSKVIDNPNYLSTKVPNQLIVASGWKPGFSSDEDAVLWAEKFGANQIINLTNIDYVYNKDPRKFSDAKPIKNIAWSDYQKIVGTKWTPRGSWPFDPIASQSAKKLKLTVVILNGRNLKNLENYLKGKSFKGTIIGV